MTTLERGTMIRQVLSADGLVCAVSGVGLMAGAGLVSGLLGIPAGLLQVAGGILLVCAAYIGALVSRPAPARAALWGLVGINTIWALESVALPLLGWITPTAAGWAFLVLQALAVAAFTAYYVAYLRRG